MGLKPVFDSSDAFFNAEAAQSAYELVMKMDEEEARAFTTMVVLDTLWETIEKNERTLQRHLNEVVAKQAALGAQVAARRGDEELAKSLEGISKAGRNQYFYGAQFEEHDYNRDRRSGQFRAKVKIVTDKPIAEKQAARLGLPTEKTGNKSQQSGLKGAQLAAHQQEYYQVKAFLDAFEAGGLADSVDYLITTDKGTFKHSGSRYPSKAEIDPAEERILAIEARPVGLHAGGASFGLVGALGGGAEAQQQAGIYGERVATHAPAFQDAWLNGAEETSSSNARLYNRVAAGSDFVGNVAPYGSKLQLAAKFGSIVGHQGPEAEKVLGPRARLTMYRYRGTEKKPDGDLTSQYNRLVGGYANEAISPEAHQDFRQQQVKALVSARRKKGSELTQAERAQAIAAVDKPSPGASQRSDVGRQRAFQYAVSYMDQKVPKKGLYDLNLKSGVTPPSEGIIIDKNGKIVTQAIGYGDDHYLPFNLKNLTGLRGGEYVRTRSAGGPTREDIYTGLVMGAQRVTVVSRSGVFTVEFDDTFRGSRRYNDKAARMVSRYEKLLDAVKSKNVSRMDVEPSVKRKIAQEVEDDLGDWTSPRDKRTEFNRRIAEYKAFPTLSDEDEAQIQTVFERQKTGVESRDRELLADLRNQAQESKAFNYELNGEGYAAAITALQEQFPYYIADAHHRPRPSRTPGRYENERDKGYVKPRHNRPEDALEGFYDTSIKGTPFKGETNFDGEATGKYTADSADYQNWKYNKQNPNNHQSGGRIVSVSAGGEGGGPRVSGQGPAVTEKEIAEDNLARKVAKKTQADAAWELKTHARLRVDGDGQFGDWINKDEGDFKKWLETPSNLKKFEQDIEVLNASKMPRTGNPVIDSKLVVNYKATKGLGGAEEYNFGAHRATLPDAPFEFKGREFLLTKDTKHKDAALRRLAKETPLPGHPPLDQISGDQEFRKALESAQQLREMAHDAKDAGMSPKAYARALQEDDKISDVGDNTLRYLANPEQADKLVDNVNKAWRIRYNLTETQRHMKAQGLERTKELPKAEEIAEIPKVNSGFDETDNAVLRPAFEAKAALEKAEEHSKVADVEGLIQDYIHAKVSRKDVDLMLAQGALQDYLDKLP